MKPIDTPVIMEGKTPEQNISAIRGWANGIAGELTYQIATLESQIEELKEEVARLKEANDGL